MSAGGVVEMNFPEDFMWGATLSAHQVEGENYHSDWWRWEQRTGRIAGGTTSARAAGHFHLYEDDFALARKLGINALVVSLAWSRIQPEADVFDETALDHYGAVFDAMEKEGITPVAVMHDVTMPRWFAEAGAWHNAESSVYFMHYANRVAETLARRCGWWIPIWEPGHTAYMRRVAGLWPDAGSGSNKALRNMARGYTHAYETLHGLRPGGMVGVSVRTARTLAVEEDRPWDVRAAKRVQQRHHHGFLELLKSEMGGKLYADFIGVNYHGRQLVRFTPARPRHQFAVMVDGSGVPVRPDAYQPDPAGLREVLTEMSRYQIPMVVTANGIPTNQDSDRCAFLLEHAWVLGQCLQAGLDVRGYFHRSLLDGFEYHRGYADRYGLVYIDWETLSRTPNKSAFLLQEIARDHGIRPGILSKYRPDWSPPEVSQP